jgi:hypothetical protein
MLAAVVLLAATASPHAASHASALTIRCQTTPLYAFPSGQHLPIRIPGSVATLGQRFHLLSGLRTTLGGNQYYETDVPVNLPGYTPDDHSWVRTDCAQPSP